MAVNTVYQYTPAELDELVKYGTSPTYNARIAAYNASQDTQTPASVAGVQAGIQSGVGGQSAAVGGATQMGVPTQSAAVAGATQMGTYNQYGVSEQGDPLARTAAQAAAQGETSFGWQGRLYRLQVNGDWVNEAGDTVAKAQVDAVVKPAAVAGATQTGTQVTTQPAAVTGAQQTNPSTAPNNQTIVGAGGTQYTTGATPGSQASATPTAPAVAATPAAQTQSSAVQYNSAWGTYGITPQVWSTLSATQQAMVAASMSAANSLYASTGSTVTLAQALQAAAADPTITAKYADQAKVDASNLQTTLNNIATTARITAASQQISMSNDTKALAQKYASVGQAYSGYRQKAEEQLKTTQGGVIESTAQDLQSQINQAAQPVEKALGSSALTGIALPQVNYTNPLTGTTQNLSYTPIGGLTGSDVTSKQEDVNKLAGQYVTAGQTSAVKTS
jgi:hypothetical protein